VTARSGAERGWQLYRAGRPSEALTRFDATLAATPEDYSAVIGRGRCHRALGAYEDAIVDFTRAHVLRPDAARPLFERGAILILTGCYDESLADYEAATLLEPTYPGTASYFAELFLYTGRAHEALATSEQAICDEPTNVVHRVNAAHAHLLLGDVERASRAYADVAGQIDPGKGMTGAAIALGDLALMRSAGIEPPGATAIERCLQDRVDGAS
jgi:tetratricopeptide (TPR) repeat protein